MKEVIERTGVKRHQKAEEGDCLKNCSTAFFSRTATCAMVCTATQDVAAPPEIDKGAPAMSLETSPANDDDEDDDDDYECDDAI